MKKDKTLYLLLFIIALMLTLEAYAQIPIMYVINWFAMPILLLIFIGVMICGWNDSGDDHDSNDEK